MYAKVIKHSKYSGVELITMEVEFHRFILPEMNTHRVFSRNYQSSRAVPVENTIDQVKTNPAMPVHWGKNQSGMVAERQLDGRSKADAIAYWENAAFDAATIAKKMVDLGVHKQVAGRILEPFVWTKGVITATKGGWESFFKLRCHPDAQPEIQAIAEIIREEIRASTPQNLERGKAHLPYVDSCEPTIDNVMISASCCAQVSYRRLDASIDKAKKIYDMLNLPIDGKYPVDPPHFSPAEHVAFADLKDAYAGNFCTGWVQYRKLLEVGDERLYVKT